MQEDWSLDEDEAYLFSSSYLSFVRRQPADFTAEDKQQLTRQVDGARARRVVSGIDGANQEIFIG